MALSDHIQSPMGQQMIQLTNDSQTECYSNTALAVLLGNPVMTSFLTTVSCDSDLVNNVRGLAAGRPSNTVQSGRGVRAALVTARPGAAQFAQYNREEDCHEFLTWLLDGLEQEMPLNLRTKFFSLFRFYSNYTFCHVQFHP